jgi:uncharacterized protein (TIGR03435 family)
MIHEVAAKNGKSRNSLPNAVLQCFVIFLSQRIAPMEKAIKWYLLMNCAGCLMFSQPPEPPPTFEIADVHVSAKTPNPFMRTGPVRGGRYEVKNANMVDLVRIAYGFAPDKVLGGPSWLEMDRFDVIAKLPADTPPETRNLMMQSLLADRFKLVVHKEIKPLPTYALTVGKKLQLKEAAGTEETGCRPETAPGPPRESATRIITGGPNGVVSIDLGPGATIHYMCRNMTMAAFATGLREMGAEVGPNQVLDETGLKGNWNFDLRFTYIRGPMAGEAGERISIFAAVEKQLGLKLEERQVPTPVMVVDSVNEKPSPNPPGIGEVLPAPPRPTEFEVASIKPSRSDERGGRWGMQPGGRFSAENILFRTLIDRAFNAGNVLNGDQITGMPDFVNSERFDIVASAPSAGTGAPAIDNEALLPMLRALLVDRFKMAYHTEERPVSAYTLVAAKPKMKKADPSSRTFCKNMPPPPSAGPGSQLLNCQNTTMAQLADRLQNMATELSWPVLDATEIEGGWDFSLTYTRNPGMLRGRSGTATAEGGVPLASEPTGAVSIFEAMEKQLGLKLEMHKRPMPVIVIDHIEQKPTDN